jgi:hypothetical protein
MTLDPNGSHSAGEARGELSDALASASVRGGDGSSERVEPGGAGPWWRLRSLLLSRWALLLAAAVIGGVIGAFFVANPHLIPNVEEGSAGAASPYSGAVVVPGAWEYRSARLLSSLRVRRRPYDASVRIRGYCIGAPTRNSVTKLVDERWLLLGDSHFIPASYVHSTMPYANVPPLPCPPLRGVGGPASISLIAARIGGTIELHAVSPHATVVGFAVFDRGARLWRPVALELQGVHGFSARVRDPRALVVMAVACWAARLPAHPRSAEALNALQPLADTPEPADEAAAARVSSGAAAACSPGAYGVVHSSARPRASKRPRSGSTASSGPGSASEPVPGSAGSAAATPVEAYVPPRSAPTGGHASEAPRAGGKSSSSSSQGEESESSTSVPPLSH